MTNTRNRRWWRVLFGLATIAVLIGVNAPSAGAWPEQYWIKLLGFDHAWTITRGAGVTVAVVDSGVNDNLPDLHGQVLAGADFSGGHTDGRSDSGDNCKSATGCYGHGTAVALTIAGTGHGAGFQGVAPQTKILPIKIETRTGGTISDASIANGIRWAVDHGADIINVSAGGQAACPPIEASAVDYAYEHDVLVVAAAGNEGQPALSAPANCAGALAVTANDRDFRPWPRANNGPDLAFTCEGVGLVQESLTGAKITDSGTSIATALVSGTFALLRAHFPTTSSRDLVTRALWNVHNGLGGKVFAQKLARLGYGEILPYHALHDPLPADATNPIYADWAGLLGPAPTTHKKPANAAPGSGSQSGASPSAPATTYAPGQGAMPQISGGHGSGSGSNTAVIVGVIVAAAVVIVGVILMLVRRRGRERSASVVGGPPWPPPGGTTRG